MGSSSCAQSAIWRSTTTRTVLLLSFLLSFLIFEPAYAAAPTISSFSPTYGTAGTTVTIAGTNFSATPSSNTVKFNGILATVTYSNTTSIATSVPTGATTGRITVKVGNQTATSSTDFTVYPSPTISAFAPTGGPVNTSVTVTGTGFSGNPIDNYVVFNGTGADVNSASPTQLIVTVPHGASTGPLGVGVYGGSFTYSTGTFTVPVPSISGFSPTSGQSGTQVTITGAGFEPIASNDRVTFNGKSGVINSAASTQIVATVADGSSTGPIGVSIDDGAYVFSSNSFVIQPTITGFAPTSGAVGSSITISGTGFDTILANDTLQIAGAAATVTGVAGNQLFATVPSGTNGPICVTVSGHSACSSSNFQVVGITSISPTTGPSGTTVTITGQGFSPIIGNDYVKFGTSPVRPTVKSATPTQLVVVVPDYTPTGPVCMSISGAPQICGPTFTMPATTISSFSPTSGPPGTVVTVAGTNFNLYEVTVAGGPATVSSQTSTQVVVVVPPPSTSGPICDFFGWPAQSVCSNKTFTVPAPTVTSFSPTSGAVGTTINVSGTNFSSVPAYDIVTFNGVRATVISANATQLQVSAPFNASTGHVCVQTSLNLAAGCSVSNFTTQASSLNTFSPTGGPVGTSVTITGVGFDPTPANDVVTFSGLIAKISSASGTQLVATVPQGATTGAICAAVDSSPQLCSTVNFSVSPAISGFTPASGQSGTSVTIFGMSFDVSMPMGVKFNGLSATITSASPTQLIASAPSGVTTGPISVTVGGQTSTSRGVFAVTPKVTTFTPMTGPTNTLVTITGSNFSTTPSDDRVAFNGTAATVNSATSSQIVVAVPVGAATGPISVAVGNQTVVSRASFTVTGGSGSPTSYQYDADGRLQQVIPPTGNPNQYNYDALGNLASITNAPAGALAVFSVSPGQGAAGDSITINGQGFDSSAANDQVSFNATPATILFATATQLIVTVPSNATTGSVSVTVNGTTSGSPAPFVVTN